jgi:hypothetical protein
VVCDDGAQILGDSDCHFSGNPFYQDGLRSDTWPHAVEFPILIPESMLRQMVGTKFLNLFDDEDDAKKQHGTATSSRENAKKPVDETVAQSDDMQDPASPQPLPSEQPSQPGKPWPHGFSAATRPRRFSPGHWARHAMKI